MRLHCTFRTGGPADLFVRVRTADELQNVLPLLRADEIPVFILGRGSNLLVGDGGYRGAVIAMMPEPGRPETDFGKVTADPESGVVRAGAGVTDAALFAASRDASLTGLEFASGIPGTVGGAMVMNAGAYGGEMKQVVSAVDILQGDGTIQTYDNAGMRFGYRTSILKKMPGIVLAASFQLSHGDRDEIAAKAADFNARRKAKQPLSLGSAGSTFKRPAGYFAGKLIQDAGLSGFRIGDAGVSTLHCGFVVNYGNAASAEVRAVIEAVQKRVLENSGVTLEPEVIFLGEF